MSGLHLLAAVLLGTGVAVELLCCLGVATMRRTLDRLHYLSPATALGPLLIALAFLAGHAGFQATIKAFLAAAMLLIVGPVLTQATARAAEQTPEDEAD